MKYIAGFIGVGNMGGSLLEAVCKAISPKSVALYDVFEEKAKQVSISTGANFVDIEELIKNCKYVFLGVKPNTISSVIANIKKYISSDTVIVSMAAGVSVDKICNEAGTEKVIRIMPNTPASVGAGMILYTIGKAVTEIEVSEFRNIMSCTGVVDYIDENLIDAAAALSGCGPAFVYMFIEALADGAVECGLPREKALSYAKQMVYGSALLSIKSDKHPGQLKDEVCSPGGTTIEGVMSLEKGAFRHTVADAIMSSYNKTAKLVK